MLYTFTLTLYFTVLTYAQRLNSLFKIKFNQIEFTQTVTAKLTVTTTMHYRYDYESV